MNELAANASLPPDLARVVETAIGASLSANTVRAYKGAWGAWTAFAEVHGLDALPASPADFAGYLADRFRSGASMPTLRLAVAAVAKAHDAASKPSPTSHPAVKQVLAGFARQLAGAGGQKQAKALDSNAVAVVRHHLRRDVDTVPLAAAKMSLVSVVSDAGLRRSEAAALAWDDVTIEADGTSRLLIRKSKNDQYGEGAVVAVTEQATNDLLRWRRLQGCGESVWGIGPEQVHRRIARVCRDAGLGEGYGGHSGRVGMAVRLVKNQAPTATALRQGRWQDVRMLRRYTRNESAAEVLAYL